MANQEQAEKFRTDLKLCALASPFIGLSLSDINRQDYTFGTSSYVGLEQVGIWCAAPLITLEFHWNLLDNPEYDCPVSELPHNFPNWNNKMFSPLCRPWYKT